MGFRLMDFLRRKKEKRVPKVDAQVESVKPLVEEKEANGMNSEFVNGILFEENMFENEQPDSVVVYDVDGKLVE